jgi:hypothetical protein
MKAENLTSGEELQSYFVKRIEKFLNSKGKRLIGWDQILEGGLPPNATVMSYRSQKTCTDSVKAGHDVVMAQTFPLYFDYANGTAEKVYGFEPVSKELSADEGRHILGAQGQMWTNGHESEEVIESRVFPRAAALAEVTWTPPSRRDYKSFAARLRPHLLRLGALGVHYDDPFCEIVGRWTVLPEAAKPPALEWPLTNGVSGAGRYEFAFRSEQGGRFEIQGIEILQDGKILASDLHAGFTEARRDRKNIYVVELPDSSGRQLILRATAGIKGNKRSQGRVEIRSSPATNS